MSPYLTEEDAYPTIFSRGDAVKCTENNILKIPKGTEILDYEFAYFVVREDLPKVHTLYIPQSVEIIESMRGDYSSGPYGYKDNPFCKIIVDENNEHYCSQDGVLFSKDMKNLICYPCGKPDKTYQIPAGVETIKSGAFLNVEHLAEVTASDSLREVEEGAFTACGYLDFPDFLSIYRLDDQIILSFPVVKDNGYRISDERYYIRLTETSIEQISKKAFDTYSSQGVQRVSERGERRTAIQLFCTFIEDQFWTFTSEEQIIDSENIEERLLNFLNVFYNEW